MFDVFVHPHPYFCVILLFFVCLFFLLVFFYCRRFFYFYGRLGDYTKLRESQKMGELASETHGIYLKYSTLPENR